MWSVNNNILLNIAHHLVLAASSSMSNVEQSFMSNRIRRHLEGPALFACVDLRDSVHAFIALEPASPAAKTVE